MSSILVCVLHAIPGCEVCAKHVLINCSYDVPYTGGSSIDGSVIYIDRKYPRSIGTSIGRKILLHPYLILHEVTEWPLVHKWGLSYNEAHVLAVAVEEKALTRDGLPVDEYYGLTWKYIEANEQVENIHHTPPDLDLTPYREDKRMEILQRMREIGHIQLKSGDKSTDK